jgi:hypothetical protein
MSGEQLEQIGSHEPLRARESTQAGSERVFGFVFAVVFTLVALYPLLADGPVRVWAIIVAVLLAILAIVRPRTLRLANLIWARFGLMLHKITNPIILGAIFFVVITPVAFVLRLAGRDLLKLKSDHDASSYWIKRDPPGPAPEGMARQF